MIEEIFKVIFRVIALIIFKYFFYIVGAIVLKLLTIGKYPNLNDYYDDFKEDPFVIVSDSAVVSGFGVLIFCTAFFFFLYYTNP